MYPKSTVQVSIKQQRKIIPLLNCGWRNRRPAFRSRLRVRLSSAIDCWPSSARKKVSPLSEIRRTLSAWGVHVPNWTTYFFSSLFLVLFMTWHSYCPSSLNFSLFWSAPHIPPSFMSLRASVGKSLVWPRAANQRAWEVAERVQAAILGTAASSRAWVAAVFFSPQASALTTKPLSFYFVNSSSKGVFEGLLFDRCQVLQQFRWFPSVYDSFPPKIWIARHIFACEIIYTPLKF